MTDAETNHLQRPPGTVKGGTWETRFTAALSATITTLRKEAEKAQPILWLPMAMALGATLWFSLDTNPPLPVIAGAVTFLAGWLLIFGGGRLHFLLLVALGFSAGMLAADIQTKRHGTVLLDGEVTTRVQGRVIDRDFDHAGRWRYTVDVHATSDPEIRRPPETVRLVVRARHDPIPIGDGISGTARLRPPSGPALPGQFDFAFQAFFQGIGANGFFYGRPQADEFAPENDNAVVLQDVRERLARLRETISQRIRSVLPGEAGSLAAALTVAERRAIPPDTVEALRASGLAHILAISGLHMALVAGTFFYFVRAGFSLFPVAVQTLPVKKIAAAGALLVSAIYLVLSGASVSTQRAFIMLAVVLVAVLLDRRAFTMRNVALAAILIILITPSAVVGPGFQMSFAATAALVATYAYWDGRWPERISGDGSSSITIVYAVLGFFTALAVTSLVAGLATAPYAAYHFHRIASYGLLANLAAMPVVTFIVMPAGLFAMLAMPFGFEHWPLVVMGKGLEIVTAIARHVEGLGGMLVVGQIDRIAFAVLVAGFLIFVLMQTRLRLIGIALMTAAGLAIGSSGPPPVPDMVISEDGRLVGIRSGDGIASNRTSPPGFIFDQWQRAYGGVVHVGPHIRDPDDADNARLTLSHALRDKPGEGPVFSCLKDSFCAAVSKHGTRIVLLEDLSLIGAACDEADLVVTARRIAMQRCYSGARLITGRMLRQSGSLELSFEENGLFSVKSAVGAVERPWTQHRQYNWRSRRFENDLPDWLLSQPAQ